MIFHRAKYWAVGQVKRHPVLWPLFWEFGGRTTFLLPHDKSYYGFRHFAKSSYGQFLDIGANNGITALGINKVLPNYAIVSVEADPSHALALERVKSRIHTFDYHIVGASDQAKTMTVYIPRVDGSIIHALTSTDLDYLKIAVARDFGEKRAKRMVCECRQIRTIPLDELGISPDLVKIDIEGHELPALRGFEKTIERERPVILLEFTPEYFTKCENFLRKRDYGFFTYNDQSDYFTTFDVTSQREKWPNSSLQINVFCVPRERSAPL